MPPACLVMTKKSFFGFCVSLVSKNPYDLGSQIRFRILPKKRTLIPHDIIFNFFPPIIQLSFAFSYRDDSKLLSFFYFCCSFSLRALIEFGMQFLFLPVLEVFQLQLQLQLYFNFQHTMQYLYPDSGQTSDKRESKSA